MSLVDFEINWPLGDQLLLTTFAENFMHGL